MTIDDKGEGRYMVATENGAIYLHTDDLDEAKERAAEMNTPEHLTEMREVLGDDSYDPGTARVFEERYEYGKGHYLEKVT